MKFTPAGSLLILFAFLVADCPDAHAAVPLTKVLLTTGSSSEREGALYVAQDQGYFRKYGLDVTLVQVRNGPGRHGGAQFRRVAAALGIGVGGESRRDRRGCRLSFRRRLHQSLDRRLCG